MESWRGVGWDGGVWGERGGGRGWDEEERGVWREAQVCVTGKRRKLHSDQRQLRRV